MISHPAWATEAAILAEGEGNLSVAVTVVGPQGSADLRVPDDLPIGQFIGQIASEIGAHRGGNRWRLRTATGQELDPARSLRAQSVRAGSTLLMHEEANRHTAVYDDPAALIHASRPPSAPQKWRDGTVAISLGAGTVAAAHGAAGSEVSVPTMLGLGFLVAAIGLLAHRRSLPYTRGTSWLLAIAGTVWFTVEWAAAHWSDPVAGAAAVLTLAVGGLRFTPVVALGLTGLSVTRDPTAHSAARFAVVVRGLMVSCAVLGELCAGLLWASGHLVWSILAVLGLCSVAIVLASSADIVVRSCALLTPALATLTWSVAARHPPVEILLPLCGVLIVVAARTMWDPLAPSAARARIAELGGALAAFAMAPCLVLGWGFLDPLFPNLSGTLL